ncbi:putative DNA-binding protein [Bacteroides zoogleoformans]|nr:putative DNA-binding protein [Bacteroides zoogleoformans]
MSAFANGLGGSLLLGIDNDGIVKGLDDICYKKKAIDYKDYFRLKFKSTVSQFQGIIFASSGTTNVGDQSR